MAESMKGLHRTHRCTEVSNQNIGETVTVMGWVQKRRNLGSLIFIDLRDRSGLLQVVFDEPQVGSEGFEKAGNLRSEFVVAVTGVVQKRSAAVNESLKTGDIEVIANDIRILSEAETPPFPIEENCQTKEELRLKYRYLDLRRPDLQRNIMMKSKVSMLLRNFMEKEGFLEIETPILMKSTPEGARDYLVPSRVHPGSFYALPQSPQLYKQLLYLFTMVDNKTDAGLLCHPTQNEAESNTYYFDFDRLKSSDRYDNILFEITLAMKKLQSIGLSNDEKQRIFEAFIVTWSSYVGSEKLKLLNIGGINSDESAITEVSRWIAETLNIYETGKEKERMEKILDVIYSNFDNTELNIQYIAKNILFMNEDYFGRVFIRNMHLKFSAYLEQSRIEMAKRLLEYNPDMRIAMLTELIGYPADGQYFSKTFRKVCGMTPTEYRENLKKQTYRKFNIG